MIFVRHPYARHAVRLLSSPFLQSHDVWSTSQSLPSFSLFALSHLCSTRTHTPLLVLVSMARNKRERSPAQEQHGQGHTTSTSNKKSKKAPAPNPKPFGQYFTRTESGKAILLPPVLHPTVNEATNEAASGFRPKRSVSGATKPKVQVFLRCRAAARATLTHVTGSGWETGQIEG